MKISAKWLTNLFTWNQHKSKKVRNKAHFFQYEVWNSSIDTKYTVNAIVIICIGIFLQYYSDNMNDKIVDQYEYSGKFYILRFAYYFLLKHIHGIILSTSIYLY